MQKAKQDEFGIQRENVTRYFFWKHVLSILLGGIFMYGAGIIFAIIYAFTIGTWLPKKQSEARRYWLEGSTLRVEQGVYYLKRKTIPLDRVTDIVLAQGPFKRYFGLWSLKIQTAGRGGKAEAVLIGLENPEEIRNQILQARDAAKKTG